MTDTEFAALLRSKRTSTQEDADRLAEKHGSLARYAIRNERHSPSDH